MPVIRATSATAVPTARQLATDLARWVRDSSPLSAAPQLLGQVEALSQEALTGPLDVEIRVAPSAVPDTAFWTSLGAEPVEAAVDATRHLPLPGNRQARVRVATHTDPAGARAGAVVPPILVWVATADDDQARLLADAAPDRPLVAVTGVADRADALRRAAREHAWCVMGAADRSLAERLGEPPFLEALDVLRAAALAQALESLATVFQVAHDAELRGLRARRALLQQRTARIPAAASATRAASDVISDVRTRIQRQFSEFSRGIEDRWATLTSHNGPTWASLDARLASLAMLAERPKSRVLATSIPADFLDEWTSHLRETIARSAQADVVAMGDQFRTLGDEIVQSVARDGGPAVIVTFQHFDRARLDRVAAEALAVARPYQGEMPRPGMFEYLMIARRYQILLFMFMSAFGLSFLRTYREFTIPVGVVLLLLGGFNVYNSVRRERYEGRRRELEKARELLRTDARRVLADVQRAWTSLVSQHLSDQAPLITGQIDATIRDFAARASDEAGAERHRVQRQLQGFETTERRLITTARGRETASTAVAQFRGELRQLLSTTLRAGLGA